MLKVVRFYWSINSDASFLLVNKNVNTEMESVVGSVVVVLLCRRFLEDKNYNRFPWKFRSRIFIYPFPE